MASRACPFIGGEQPRLNCWIGALPSLRKESSVLLPRTCPLTSITGQGIEGRICCAGNCTAAAIIIAVITVVAVIPVAVIPVILPRRDECHARPPGCPRVEVSRKSPHPAR